MALHQSAAVSRSVVAACGAALVLVTAVPVVARPEPGAPQATQNPTFRSRTDLVQVDVVAVDKDGHHVRGLKPEDFTLFDRKKPQVIAAFEEIQHRPAPVLDVAPVGVPASGERLVAKDVASNQSAQSSRLVVIVVDDLHIYKSRTDRARDIAQKVVADLGPEASMAVLFTSGNQSTEVTDDRAILQAALNTLKGRKPWARPTPAIDAQMPGRIDPEMSMEAAFAAISKAQDAKLQDFADNMSLYKTVQNAAKMLGAGDMRRKAFVLISEGVAKELTGIFGAMAPPGEAPEGGAAYAAGGGAEATITPPQEGYHAYALIQMMESMRRSNVVTYAIDPRGEVSTRDLERECFPAFGFAAADPCLGETGDGPAAWSSWVRQAQRGLALTSEASGGFAIVNTDDFTSGLTRIVDDLDHYYLLGFYPADPEGKGYRQLDVKVNRPDVTLRFRHGYDPSGPPAAPANTDPLMALSAGVMPRADLPLRLTAVPRPTLNAARGATTGTRVSVELEVTVPRRDVTQADGTLHDALRYSLVAVNLKSKKVEMSVGNSATLASARAPRAAVGETIAYQIPIEVRLPPGRYQLRASATSDTLAKGGSVYLIVDVPDYRQPRLAMSALMIGYAEGARLPIAKSGAAGAAGAPGAASTPDAAGAADAFVPSLDRTFASGDTLRLFLEVAAQDPTQALRATVQIRDGAGTSVKTATVPFTPANSGSQFDMRVPLAGLPAGAYVLRVTMTGPAQTGQRETTFSVK